MNVREFLNDREVRFESIQHPPAFEAQRLAEAVDVTGHDVAKTVLVEASGECVLLVVPASHQVDFELARSALRSRDVELAGEGRLADQFPDCELGAVPPFGSRYGMPTVVDAALAEGETIVFEGNRHDEAIRMKVADYLELEKPAVTRLSRAPA